MEENDSLDNFALFITGLRSKAQNYVAHLQVGRKDEKIKF